MLNELIISLSFSAWYSSVLIMTKMDRRSRFCLDYRALNRRIKADRWVLVRIKEIFDGLNESSIFTVLDLFAGYRYRKNHVSEICKEMTAFT